MGVCRDNPKGEETGASQKITQRPQQVQKDLENKQCQNVHQRYVLRYEDVANYLKNHNRTEKNGRRFDGRIPRQKYFWHFSGLLKNLLRVKKNVKNLVEPVGT